MAASGVPLTQPPGVGTGERLAARLLSPLTRIEAGEAGTVLLLALNVFLLLGAYYVLKTVREALILSEAGAEVKSYAAAGQVLLFLIFLPLYGAAASRLGRVTLVCGCTLFFMSNLAAFIALGQAGARLGVAFYLWLGLFNMFVVAQFWGFANDLYTEEQGKRLFPLVGIGASLGAWLGAVAARIFRWLGPWGMMTAATGVLGLCALLTMAANSRERRRTGPEEARKAEAPLDRAGGFRIVWSVPYLRWIAILVLLLNLVNTVGEYLLGRFVVEEAVRQIGGGDALVSRRGEFIGEFYGDFFGWVNLTGFLLQTFVVARLFKWIGIGRALFVLPLIAMGGYLLLLAWPVLQLIRAAKILENSTDYSLNNTVRHALFLNTSREAKYRAKAAIDTLFVRLGDILQAGVVFLGAEIWRWTTPVFAAVTLGFTGVWLAAAWKINRERDRLPHA